MQIHTITPEMNSITNTFKGSQKYNYKNTKVQNTKKEFDVFKQLSKNTKPYINNMQSTIRSAQSFKNAITLTFKMLVTTFYARLYLQEASNMFTKLLDKNISNKQNLPKEVLKDIAKKL